MRLPLIPMIILLLVNVAIDYYIWRAAVNRCQSKWPSRLQFISAIIIYAVVIFAVALPRRSGSDATLATVMWLLFGYMSVLFSKVIFIVFDWIASIPKIWHKHRIKPVSLIGGVIAIVVFLAMWWGALINRYNIDVKEVEVEIPDLPEAFGGFRIVQFSDFHVGTYGSDTRFTDKVVSRINTLNPDVIVFTGDIVNRRSEELKPFVESLSHLDSPNGVYSILGNHDYGDYCDWPSEDVKRENMRELYEMQSRMHWQLLLNEHEKIYRDNDSIVLIGVENVGDPPFTVYGSLPDSYPSLDDSTVKVLLTHNPAHWVMDIADNDSINIALTLSGHTHAMQIEVGGVSPAALRYPTWGGLYPDSTGRHKLYVNIGLGTVGLPMRIGATPEITVLTLRPAKK